uniref:DUF1768 domain-containing protein n=1 Tax=Strongyloides venezuelensis TaxID=75913 RepID=A0A0K0F294_STRVS
MVFRNFRTARLILKAKYAHRAKFLGRKISNFNDSTWTRLRSNIMYKGLKIKFSNLDLKKKLKEFYINNIKCCIFIEYNNSGFWGAQNIFDDNERVNLNNRTGFNQMGRLLNMLPKELFDLM